MPIDPYSSCPCGSGKKLKFCCGDLAPDIEKVYRMLDGDQPRAALRHVEQTLARAPGRAPLLSLKATLETGLGEFDAAEASLGALLAVEPESPSAYAQMAMLVAARDSGAAAVAPLQDALERVEDAIPSKLLQAIGIVGQELLVEGRLHGARAHLWLYQGIAGEEDTGAMELLSRLNRVSDLPLLLRDQLYLREAPPGHPCEADLDEAQALASRGQWRRAAAVLDSLASRFADLPALAYNAGLVHGWLGDDGRLIEGLRVFASRGAAAGAPWDDVVEAEAIAQLLDGEPAAEVLRTTFDVADEETLIDRLTRDRRVVAYALDPSEYAAIEGPPPRHTHMLLDRPAPASGAELTVDQTPRVLGLLAFYGRQTSRSERLELVADGDGRHAEALSTLRDVAGAGLGPVADERPLGAAPGGDPSLRWRPHFPADTPPAVRRRLLDAQRREAVLEDWPARPRKALGGGTPLEAKGNPAFAVPLAAAVLNLAQSVEGRVDAATLHELRDKLGVPQPGPIDPQHADLETLPLCRLGRVDLTAVGDADLVQMYQRATLAGASEAIAAIARVAIDRPAAAAAISKEELFFRLVSLEPDTAAALRWVDRARADAEASGRSSATWDILELELHVVAGQVEQANRIMEHIRAEHLDEPGVAEQLYQLLYSLGAIPAPTAGRGGAGGDRAGDPAFAPAAAAAPAPAPSKLWTPGDPLPGGQPPSAGGKKLWSPT